MASATHGETSGYGFRPIIVTDFMTEGADCLKFDNVDRSNAFSEVTIKIDPGAHIFYWKTKDGQRNGHVWLTSICDTRRGALARRPLLFENCRPALANFITGPEVCEEECLLTVVYLTGSLTTPQFLTFVMNSPEDAQRWEESIFELATNLMLLNRPLCDFMKAEYARLKYCCATGHFILLDDIIDVFAFYGAREIVEQTATQTFPIAHHFFENSYNRAIPTFEFTERLFIKFCTSFLWHDVVRSLYNSLCRIGCNPEHCEPQQTSSSEYMTAENLMEFLNSRKFQHDPRQHEELYPKRKINECRELISQYEPSSTLAEKGLLSFDGFLAYLLSRDNSPVLGAILDSWKATNMNSSLSYHLMSASHNTYLVGKQFGRKLARADVEMYRQVLLTGCRSVEIDTWDKGGEPVVTHGSFNGGPMLVENYVKLEDVCRAIAETAFKVSSYPVVISLENNVQKRDVQEKIASVMIRVFGDLLLTEEVPESPLRPNQPLPKISQLKYKILLKGKVRRNRKNPIPSNALVKRVSAQRSLNMNVSNPVSEDEPGFGSDCDGHQLPASSRSHSISMVANQALVEASFSDVEEPDARGRRTSSVRRIFSISQNKRKISPHSNQAIAEGKLSELIIYMQSIKVPPSFDGLLMAQYKDISFEVPSFNEDDAKKLVKNLAQDIVRFTQRQMCRIYPSMKRTDSSNFLPQIFWNAGCQMIAMNYQTLDTGMQLNLAFFEQNARCGYVMKPACLTHKCARFDPYTDAPVDAVVPSSLKVQIISGHFISREPVTTYVLLEVYGLAIDTQRDRYRTDPVLENGLNPFYGSKEFDFEKQIVPPLATLRLAVMECGKSGIDAVLGERFLPVVGLKPGYRYIPLRDKLNRPLGMSALFVRIAIADFIPKAHKALVARLVDPLRRKVGGTEDMRTPVTDPLAFNGNHLPRSIFANSDSSQDCA